MKPLHLLAIASVIAIGLFGFNTVHARCPSDEPNCESTGAATLFPKPSTSQEAHFIVNSTTQCLPQNIEHYRQVYNSTMNRINNYYTVNLLHNQNQPIGNVSRQLFSLAKNGTFDDVNLASYCLGIENINRTLLVQPLPATVKVLTYNVIAMRQYLPVLLDGDYYLQQYRGITRELDQVLDRNTDLKEQIFNLKNSTGTVGNRIQALKLQIADDNETGQSLVNQMNFIQNESRALFTLDAPTKKRLDDAAATLSSMYMMGVPPKNAQNHPVQEIFANYQYKNIYIDFDPDKTINNSGRDMSPQIISDIKKITGDIPLDIKYDKIFPIGNDENTISKNTTDSANLGSNQTNVEGSGKQSLPKITSQVELDDLHHPVTMMLASHQANATDFFPSPLKQLESGIRPQEVECDNDLQLVIQYENLEPLCVDFNKLNTLLGRGLLLNLYPPNESSDGLSVEGLNDSYTVGQPIKFTVKFSGDSLSCSYPRVFLTTDNNILTWVNFGPLMMCDPEDTVEHRELSWPVDVEDLYPMKNSDSYDLVVVWNGKMLHKSFWEEPTVSQVIIPNGFSKKEAAFEPQNITVKIGVNETVKWTNKDNSQNTIISDSQDNAGFYEKTHFGSPLPSIIDPGKSFVQWFDMPGKYKYHAGSGQNGTIVVLPVDPMFEWLQLQHPRLHDDHRYSNDMVAVLRGTMVSWDNVDNVTHTITSKHIPETFDSGPIRPWARFTLDTKPLAPGYYDYYDKLNPSLTGGIRVLDPRYYNDSGLIAVAKDLNYSKMLLAAHPDAVISVVHNYYDGVDFDVEKQVYPLPTEETRTLRLEVTFDRINSGIKSVGIECLGPVSTIALTPHIEELLKSGWCLTQTN